MSHNNEPESVSSGASENSQPGEALDSEPSPKKPTYRRRRVLVACLVAAALIALAQVVAPRTNHSVANMISIGLAVIAAVYAWFQVFGVARKRGAGSALLTVTVLCLAALVGLFRYEGVSGEMWPKFASRFSAKREVRSVAQTPQIVQDTDPESHVALTDSLEFLGTGRTGVIAYREFVIPVNASDVITLWDQGIGEGWSSFSVSSDRAVTLEQRDDQECVTCYRLSDGELLWIDSHEARHQHALGGVGPRSTPTIVGDRVYAQGATGHVWCLDLQTGEVVWSQDLLELARWDQIASEAAITWGRSASPLLVDGLCVLPYGSPVAGEIVTSKMAGRSLIALDADTGSVRWTAGEDQISYASPCVMTLGGVRQIVSVNEKTITGHEIESGQPLWDFVWPGKTNSSANCAMVVPAGADRFLVGKGYGDGCALVEVKANEQGTLVAEPVMESTRILKTKFTHACVDGDTAYAISNGSLEAVNFAKKERLWSQPRRSRFGQGQMLLVGDVIVGQSEAGEVVFVKVQPTQYEELLRLPAMDSKTWNVPTISGRHLLVRNDRQAICFLLPKYKRKEVLLRRAYPGGIEAISRWLSAATPPVSIITLGRHPEGMPASGIKEPRMNTNAHESMVENQ